MTRAAPLTALLFAAASASADCTQPFAAPRAFPSVGSVSHFEIADLNGDGHADAVAFASFRSSVLHGRGDATFAPPVALPDDLAANVGTTGDLNGDGLRDAIALDGNELHAALRQSDGSFAPARITAGVEYGGSYYDDIRTADLDGDGRADVIAAEDVLGAMAIYRGNGDGTFAAPSIHADVGSDFALGDFNGDGRIDIAATGYQPALVLLLNQGEARFVSSTVAIQSTYAEGIEAADFDGDGKLDLVVAPGSSELRLLLGNGDATFRSSSFPVAASTPDFDAADLDGDGDFDLLVRDMPVNLATVLLNDGRGRFDRTGSITFVDGDFELFDLDRDGSPEIVSADSDAHVVVTRGVTGARFAGRTLERLPYSGDFLGTADLLPAAASLDGDASGDVLVTGYGTNTLSTLFGTAGGELVGRIDYDTGAGAIDLAAGDLDGDGRGDAAVVLEDETIAVLLNRGDGVLTRPVVYAVSAEPRSVALADFNRDGRLDVVVAHGEGAYVTFLPGTGGGGLGVPRLVPSPAGFTPGRPVAADFTNDGRLDLFLPDRFSSAFLRGRGDGTFDTPVPVDVDADTAVAGDFDGDGTLDLAALTTFGDLSVHHGTGAGTFLLRWATDFDTFANGMTAGDFDGDGKLDVALAVDSPGASVHVLRGNGDATLAPPGQQYATIDDAISVTAGDWNGDGNPDLFATSQSSYATVLMNECGKTGRRRRAVRH